MTTTSSTPVPTCPRESNMPAKPPAILVPGETENSPVVHSFKFKNPSNPKIIIVTTTGGGISAAAWTVAVLNRLTTENDPALNTEKISGETFKDTLRVITGASGGMVGAAFYVRNLERHVDSKNGKRLDACLKDAYNGVGKDHLSPVISRLAFHDVYWNMWPTGQNTSAPDQIRRRASAPVPWHNRRA